MFKLIKIIPMKANANLMRFHKFILSFSFLMIFASFFIIFTKPFNYGIDFSGGVLIEIKTSKPTSIEKLRTDLKFYTPEIQADANSDSIFSIRLPKSNKTETEIVKMVNDVKDILGKDTEYRNTQVVGAKVSSELIKDSVVAICFALLVISLYIWFRFELPFAIGAGVSLSHDIILTLAMLILTKLEFNLTTLAALLTLAGYSVNDTVVVYDRVRENLGKYKGKTMNEIINISINETISGTLLTSVTTFIATLMIFWYGGEVLKGFSSVMLFGIVVGTFSSVFLSTSLLLYISNIRSKGKKK